MWQFYSRNDDILVFTNGEKWNPIPSEGMIQSHPELTGALIIGNGRFQAAALLEPKTHQTSTLQLIDEVWPLIARANAKAQRFGHIARSKVAVVPSGSFIRAPKGTIVRELNIGKFTDIIEGLYKSEGAVHIVEPRKFGIGSDGSCTSESGILSFVRQCVDAMSTVSIKDDNDDLYTNGLDSMETLELSKLLKRSLSTVIDKERLSFLGHQTVFKHPSIERLARCIEACLSGGPGPFNNDRLIGSSEMEQVVAQYVGSSGKARRDLSNNASPSRIAMARCDDRKHRCNRSTTPSSTHIFGQSGQSDLSGSIICKSPFKSHVRLARYGYAFKDGFPRSSSRSAWLRPYRIRPQKLENRRCPNTQRLESRLQSRFDLIRAVAEWSPQCQRVVCEAYSKDASYRLHEFCRISVWL